MDCAEDGYPRVDRDREFEPRVRDQRVELSNVGFFDRVGVGAEVARVESKVVESFAVCCDEVEEVRFGKDEVVEDEHFEVWPAGGW